MVESIPDPVAPQSKGTSRVVVAYETTATRELAIRSSQELAGLFAGEAGLNVRWWSFALLCDPAFAKDAAVQASDADLLVFAITPAGDLPQEIKLWMENWITHRTVREGAVVGLVLLEGHSRPGEIACLKEIYLRHAAHRAGMDYLSQLPSALPKAMPDSLDSYRERAGQVTSVLDEILRTCLPPPNPHR
jgi:hypothetical protein